MESNEKRALEALKTLFGRVPMVPTGVEALGALISRNSRLSAVPEVETIRGLWSELSEEAGGGNLCSTSVGRIDELKENLKERARCAKIERGNEMDDVRKQAFLDLAELIGVRAALTWLHRDCVVIFMTEDED